MKLLRQVVKYLRALARWLWWGAPRRSPEQVKDIFYSFCSPCGHYHPGLGECTMCECSVSPNSDERNKITFATEHCPDDLW